MQTLPSVCLRLKASINGPVGHLTISNAAKRNAISIEMWRAIPVLMAALAHEPGVRVIILDSDSGHFSAGADISEFETMRATPESSRAYEAENVRAFEAIMNCPRPVIASIRGFCFGAGAGLALSCDLRIAASDAAFAIPAARLGVAYPPQAFAPIVAAIGQHRTKELFFTGKRIGAAEAEALGMLTSVVAVDELDAAVLKLALEIAKGAPMTLTATKRAVDAVAGSPVALPPDALQTLADACFDSADAVEGSTAFRDKREPRFTGK